MQQAGDERTGSGERVKNMHTFVGERLSKLLFQHVIHAVNNKINHLNRRIHNAQALCHSRERVPEELIVQLYDNLLLTFSCGNAVCTHFYRLIEAVQRAGFFFKMMLLQRVKHVLHRHTHRVMVGKIVIRKQGIKDRLGYQVLCQHFNDFIVGNTVIQIITQFIGKCPEGTDFYLITRIFENTVNAVDMRAGNFSDIVRPVFPVMPVTAFFNDFRVQGTLNLTD